MGDIVNRSIIDPLNLPAKFPTQMHAPQFWEQLGRTVATYGFLERALGSAIFALTATRQYPPDKIVAAYDAWQAKLELALTCTLSNLADMFGKAARENQDVTLTNVTDLVDDLKKAAVIRNALCHASWPTAPIDGASVPRFVNRELMEFRTAIDVPYLEQVQAHVSELICSVVSTVTSSGWQFPGTSGPGKPIM